MLLVMLILAQTGEVSPADAPPPSPPPAAPKASDVLAPPLQGDQLQRKMDRLRRMDPDEAAKAAADLVERLPKVDIDKVPRAPPVPMPEVKDYASLPEAEQVKYSAREFFAQLLAGDARAIVNSCGFPFQLEERRLQTPDELFQEWLRNLRAKRTDLLTLYDIEVLTPADMEKKYGKPPARLQNLPWRNAKTYLAVANLSGHAAVAVLKQQGQAWAVVGYAD
jgi:hypothetical protein